jgi:SAM-dependent methyltransferase
MAIGPVVRGLFGSHEHRVAALYRSVFVDIDAYAELIGQWVPRACNILEVGCGEGAITERLAQLFPQAQITAIDITPRAGRLYRGRSDGVEFRQAMVQEVAAAQPRAFDFVLLSDVLHHVPEALRPGILDAVREALAPGGVFLFKDWEFSTTPIHWLCHAGDRWLTGDKVRYLRKGEASELIDASLPDAMVAANARIRPWRNNFAMLIRA